MSGAMRAVSTYTDTAAAAIHPTGAAASPAHTLWRDDSARAPWRRTGYRRGRVLTVTRRAPPASRQLELRIEKRVRDVDRQVRGHVRDRVEHDGGLHDDVVAGEDRVHHQPADPWPSEDGFHDHVAAQQFPNLQPGDRDRRDERVAK